jgi:hypothetical protein
VKDNTQSANTGGSNTVSVGHTSGAPTTNQPVFGYNPQRESALAREGAIGSGTRHEGDDHHLARDGALGAGAGGAAYEAEKHHHGGKHPGSRTDEYPEYTDVLDPNPSHHNVQPNQHGGSSHLGRDGALGAGAGGAAYEAEKHHKHDKDLSAAEKEQKREHKHELKEEKREHKQEHKHKEKDEHKPGLLSRILRKHSSLL